MDEKHALPRAIRLARTHLVIRPVRESDRAALEAIAAQIWDGEDYLPRVFDEWLSDPQGGFFVAELRGQVLGVAKMTRLAEGEWWMQGLRVDPAVQGQGLGRILHHFLTNQVRQYGVGEVRFSTASSSHAIHHLAQETGFRREMVYPVLHAPALDEPPQGWRALHEDDLLQAWQWLQHSAHFEQACRSLEWNWTFYRITEALLRDRLHAGLVYGWATDANATPDRILIVNPARASDDPPSALKVGYLDAPEATLTEAVRDARRLAAALGRARVRVKPPKPQLDTFKRAGFQREWEGEVGLYARNVVLTQQVDVADGAFFAPETQNERATAQPKTEELEER